MFTTTTNTLTTGGVIQQSEAERKHEAACPSCGYCPHCGRGGYWTMPYYPGPFYPQYPLYPTYPTWVTS